MDFFSISNTKDIFFKPAWELYEEAFPKKEKRFIEEQLQVLKNTNYTFNAILVDNQFIGFLAFWQIDEFIFIEHFAIAKEFRAKNYGSLTLSAFLKNHPNVILEIDPPLDAISLKRLHFYEKLGFVQNKIEHFQVQFRQGDTLIPLELLSFKTPLSLKKYKQLYLSLQQKLPL